jgi:hypothetical protein
MKSFFIGLAVFVVLVVVLFGLIPLAMPFVLVYAIYSRTLQTIEAFRPRKAKAKQRRLFDDVSSVSPALSKNGS